MRDALWDEKIAVFLQFRFGRRVSKDVTEKQVNK